MLTDVILSRIVCNLGFCNIFITVYPDIPIQFDRTDNILEYFMNFDLKGYLNNFCQFLSSYYLQCFKNHL